MLDSLVQHTAIELPWVVSGVDVKSELWTYRWREDADRSEPYVCVMDGGRAWQFPWTPPQPHPQPRLDTPPLTHREASSWDWHYLHHDWIPPSSLSSLVAEDNPVELETSFFGEGTLQKALGDRSNYSRFFDKLECNVAHICEAFYNPAVRFTGDRRGMIPEVVKLTFFDGDPRGILEFAMYLFLYAKAYNYHQANIDRVLFGRRLLNIYYFIRGMAVITTGVRHPSFNVGVLDFFTDPWYFASNVSGFRGVEFPTALLSDRLVPFPVSAAAVPSLPIGIKDVRGLQCLHGWDTADLIPIEMHLMLFPSDERRWTADILTVDPTDGRTRDSIPIFGWSQCKACETPFISSGSDLAQEFDAYDSTLGPDRFPDHPLIRIAETCTTLVNHGALDDRNIALHEVMIVLGWCKDIANLAIEYWDDFNADVASYYCSRRLENLLTATRQTALIAKGRTQDKQMQAKRQRDADPGSVSASSKKSTK